MLSATYTLHLQPTVKKSFIMSPRFPPELAPANIYLIVFEKSSIVLVGTAPSEHGK